MLVTPAELHQLVLAIERSAREAEARGRYDVADRLAWRAAALRRANP